MYVPPLPQFTGKPHTSYRANRQGAHSKWTGYQANAHAASMNFQASDAQELREALMVKTAPISLATLQDLTRSRRLP